MSERVPIVGDVVWFVESIPTTSGERELRAPLPAIVTRVLNEKTVNLQVFADGSRLVFPKTSVILDKGDGLGGWRWRETAQEGRVTP